MTVKNWLKSRPALALLAVVDRQHLADIVVTSSSPIDVCSISSV
jgi:hypothetical protein